MTGEWVDDYGDTLFIGALGKEWVDIDVEGTSVHLTLDQAAEVRDKLDEIVQAARS